MVITAKLKVVRVRGRACRHCGKARYIHARGLCRNCFNSPARDLYRPAVHVEVNGVTPECWACDVVCPRKTHVRQIGWKQRVIRLPGGKQRETYCPGCFVKWGWPELTKGV
jgi:hypothetical protein